MPLAVLTLIGIVVAAVVVLFLLGLFAPRLSRRVQRHADVDLEKAQGVVGKAPGPLGRWFAKSLGETEKATDATSRAGRHTHDAAEREKRKHGG